MSPHHGSGGGAGVASDIFNLLSTCWGLTKWKYPSSGKAALIILYRKDFVISARISTKEVELVDMIESQAHLSLH
jgi:hypothetical protein